MRRSPGWRFSCGGILLAAAFLARDADAGAANPAGPGFYCVDARQLSFRRRLLLDSLQAIANSNAPVLFVMQRAEDASWRKALEKQFGKEFESISDQEALTRFGANTPQVIYDSGQRWNLSIATSLAGIHRALLTDHPLAGHEIAIDCRNLWTNKLEAYRWALAEVLPRCHQQQLAYLGENLPFLRDYAMQQKLFVLNLDPLNDPQETRLLDEILEKFPAGTRVFGWASGAYARKAKGQNDVTVETALVRRLSRRGLMLVPADFAANLSFYSRTGPHVGQLKQQHLNRGLKLQSGRRYVLLVVSDGDNVQYDLGAMRAQWEKERPKVPVAWSLSPQLAEIGPVVMQTYYQEAAERGGWDEFVTGPSGYAYVNPGSLPASRLDKFVESTRQICRQADMTSLVILDDGARPATQVSTFLRAYAAAKFDGLWLAAMPKYAGALGATAFLNERFRLSRDNATEVAERVKQVRTDSPCVMIYVNAWDNVGDVIREFSKGLDGTCELVSATEMADLVRQWAAAIASLRLLESDPNSLQGLMPVVNEDGKFTLEDRNRIRCWLIKKSATPHYFYLDAHDGFRGGAMEIELEYLDSGTGEIALDYDSTDSRPSVEGAYKRHPTVARRENTGQWRSVRFPITDALYAGRQNGGADFRFYNGGDDLAIRAVRLRRVAP